MECMELYLSLLHNSHVKCKVWEVTWHACTNVKTHKHHILYHTQLHHTSQPHPLEWCSLPPPSNHIGTQTPTMVGLWVAPPMPHPHPSYCGGDGALLSATHNTQMCCLLSDPDPTAVLSSVLCAMLHSHHAQWEHTNTGHFCKRHPTPVAVVHSVDFWLWHQYQDTAIKQPDNTAH